MSLIRENHVLWVSPLMLSLVVHVGVYDGVVEHIVRWSMELMSLMGREMRGLETWGSIVYMFHSFALLSDFSIVSPFFLQIIQPSNLSNLRVVLSFHTAQAISI